MLCNRIRKYINNDHFLCPTTKTIIELCLEFILRKTNKKENNLKFYNYFRPIVLQTFKVKISVNFQQ